MKKKISYLILPLITAFMLAIYEPSTMYANNINDFWFDYGTLLKPSLILFFAIFVSLSLLSFAIGFICKKLKKPKLFRLYQTLFFAVFLICYIHSNYLASSLPVLTGDTINWNAPKPNIISVIICAAILVGSLILLKKFKAKTPKILNGITLAVFVMLLVGYTSLALTTDLLKPKGSVTIATDHEINLVSKDQNLFILLLDSIDSQEFQKIVDQKTEHQEALKDFTYYPDTVSAYAFTRDSIPFIFSGEWNKNEAPFNEYSTKKLSDSPILNHLSEEQYRKHFYENDYVWNDEKSLEMKNIEIAQSPDYYVFIKQELKYVFFKTLPYPLKRFSRIEGMNYSDKIRDIFGWHDSTFYHEYLEKTPEFTEEKNFSFIHLAGAHVPFDTDPETMEFFPDNKETTYEDKLEASAKCIDKFIQYLKDAGAYDNSAIVVMADHGYYETDFKGRLNPMLYIKGINETHHKMKVSDKQLHYGDLTTSFIELTQGKQNKDLFEDIPTSGRERHFIVNAFGKEEHLVEYKINGHAWEWQDKLEQTAEYDLEK